MYQFNIFKHLSRFYYSKTEELMPLRTAIDLTKHLENSTWVKQHWVEWR
jgi:hypothetical protein